MHVILFLLAMFVPAVCFSQTLDIEKFEVRQEKAIIPLLIGIALVSLAVGIYTFLQMRKMQKKNQPKPNQLDGTIADEGTSFCDIAGSPHVHANITDIWGKSTQAIKKKSGGFLGIGKTSQVTGYRYYAKFAAFIGNRIEKLIAINFDNRKWVVHDPVHHPVNMLPVREGNLFGENEGGVAGDIDIHFGYPDQEPNLEYQKYFPLVSGYPYQSYLLFRGYNFQDPFLGHTFTTPAFYLGNSGYMKEMLLWVKRTRVRNDGQGQWYEVRGDGAVVCEIGGYYVQSDSEFETQSFSLNVTRTYTGGQDAETIEFNHITMMFSPNKSGGGSGTSGQNYFEGFHEEKQTFTNTSPFDILIRVESSARGESASPEKNYELWVESGDVFVDSAYCRNSTYSPDSNSHVMGVALDVYFLEIREHRDFVENDAPDINPIHKIREILTDDTAMGKPESDINDVNFMKAADRIWDEGLGVSWAIDEKSCIEAIEELCYHVEAGIRVNRQTGLYEMVLFRDDWFAEDEIHSITENKIKDLSLEVMNSDDIANQLNVTYYDRERIKNSTFSVYENGSILTMGHTNAESVEFPYFMNMRNAEIVANWKLKQFSTPAWSGSFTTGWKEARKWNRYDLIRLPWSSKWNGTILARIMKINLGNGVDNTVTIDFEEVIPYSGEMNTSIVVDNPVDPGPKPPQPSVNAVFEAPYYLTVLRAGQTNADLELSNNPDIGYVAAIAAKPQNNSLNALLYTDGGVSEFEQVSRLDYCDILQLDQPINETASAFVVTGSLTQTANSNNLILLNGELMGFVAFDDATKVLTVKRGVLDTVPKKHGSGYLFVFDLPDVAFDSTQYAQSEVVEAQVLTTTPSGIQELSENSQAIEIRSRAIRPYPPANVKINGEYFPDEIENDLILTWVDRNRLQQTGGEIIGWYESGVTIESGVTYQLILVERDENEVELRTQNLSLGALNAFTFATSSMDANTRTIEITLKSLRDGYESYSAFNHIVELSQFFSEPHNISYVVREV
ncbi:phage tail protein [Acinetobacter indicus]|uniref:phage tail protein n=1 Tax=Acinetobacter indicus TaxID=756892 RepID=UPI0014445439|nr:phage tail protein [Acinetobacter indicus]